MHDYDAVQVYDLVYIAPEHRLEDLPMDTELSKLTSSIILLHKPIHYQNKVN